MKLLIHCAMGVVLFFVLVVARPTFAQNSKSSSTASKNATASLNTARQEVTAAQQGLAQASGRWKESDSRFRFQTRHVSTIRAKVFEEYDKSSTLEGARHEVEKLDKELSALAKPILDRVHSQPEYRALAKKHDDAEKEIKAGVDSDNQRNILLKEVMSLQTEMRRMEKAPLAENSEAKAAWTALQEARERLKEACVDRDQQIDKDSALTEAYSELQSSRQALEQAQAAVASERQKLAAAEQHMSQAMAAQRATSNRGNNSRRRR